MVLGNEMNIYLWIFNRNTGRIRNKTYNVEKISTKPNWFNFFSKSLYFQDFSIKDPIPFFVGTFGNLKKQLNPKFRESKSGLR